MLTQQDKVRALAGRFDENGGEEFSPGGVPISQIAEEYGSPFYLYHGSSFLTGCGGSGKLWARV